jgi:hypothetical protein
MGIVDCVIKLEEVLPLSVEQARVLSALPEKACTAIKRDRTEPVENTHMSDSFFCASAWFLLLSLVSSSGFLFFWNCNSELRSRASSVNKNEDTTV